MAKKRKRSIGAFVKMILGDKKNPLATVTIHGKSKKQARAKAARFRKAYIKNVRVVRLTPQGALEKLKKQYGADRAELAGNFYRLWKGKTFIRNVTFGELTKAAQVK